MRIFFFHLFPQSTISFLCFKIRGWFDIKKENQYQYFKQYVLKKILNVIYCDLCNNKNGSVMNTCKNNILSKIYHDKNVCSNLKVKEVVSCEPRKNYESCMVKVLYTLSCLTDICIPRTYKIPSCHTCVIHNL